MQPDNNQQQVASNNKLLINKTPSSLSSLFIINNPNPSKTSRLPHIMPLIETAMMTTMTTMITMTAMTTLTTMAAE
jgi:hypothetical protein